MKKHGGYDGIGETEYVWLANNQNDHLLDNNELVDGSSVTIAEVQRQLKSLNGYHENLLDALRAARGAASTPSGSNIILNEDILRKTLAECASGYTRSSRVPSQEKVCDGGPQIHTVMVEGSPRHHHHHRHDDEEDDEVTKVTHDVNVKRRLHDPNVMEVF